MTTSFLGVPINGDITRGEIRANQRPQSELAPLVQALLDDPGIVRFGWYQYTPYFNDGEPCIFHAGNLWVITSEDTCPGCKEPVSHDEEHDIKECNQESVHESFAVSYGHPTLGELKYHWDRGLNPMRIEDGFTGPDRARYGRCIALEHAICSGEFDNVLLELFGDHADVTVCRDNIQVEFYDHD